LLRRFAAGGCDAIGLIRRPPDAAAAEFLAEVSERVSWAYGDVTDRAAIETLVAEQRPDVVVHAAAVTFTEDQERADPVRVFDVNAGGTLNVLEAARRRGLQRFVYVSTGGLYGPAPAEPALDETTPLLSRSMYAVAKIASEQSLERVASLSALDVRIGRLGTAYGPMERTTPSRSNMSAVHRAVALAAAGGGLLRVAGGEIARDFCHVDDVSEAFWQLATGQALQHTIYNVGATRAAPLSEALDALAQAVPAFEWRQVAESEADVVQRAANARAGMDMSRLQRDTSWRERYPLAAGALAYLGWLQGMRSTV
jgi:UDP-glucuronate 4-epimerase